MESGIGNDLQTINDGPLISIPGENSQRIFHHFIPYDIPNESVVMLFARGKKHLFFYNDEKRS